MEKIWVAEDDASIREELKALLRANGYLPVDAPPCDLALLDINLPGRQRLCPLPEAARRIGRPRHLPHRAGRRRG